MAKEKDNKALPIIMSIAVVVVLMVVAIMTYITVTQPAPVAPPAATPQISSSSALPTDADLVAKVDANLVAIYEGMMPCADCPGIMTTIGLVADDPTTGSAEGSYEEVMVYQERDVRPLISSGRYTTQRGTDQDIDAIVYQLTDSQTGAIEFWQVVDNGLQKLDINGKVIDSSIPMNLALKVKGPAYVYN